MTVPRAAAAVASTATRKVTCPGTARSLGAGGEADVAVEVAAVTVVEGALAVTVAEGALAVVAVAAAVGAALAVGRVLMEVKTRRLPLMMSRQNRV